jgi:tryptophanyl-tRNA synthetase
MSKSLNNAIFLADSPAEVEGKVSRMYTDPQRIRADIPGRVEGNPVFVYHQAFNPDKAEVAELEERYRQGKVGDVEVKKRLARALNGFLDPIRARREEYSHDPRRVEAVLVEGTRRARIEAAETMELVRQAMGLYRLSGN